MKILITGGAGYIGSVLTPHLLAAGHRVTVLDSFMFQQSSLLGCCHCEGLDIVRGDVRNPVLLRELVRQHDVVIPLAALVGAPACDRDPIAAESVILGAAQSLVRELGRTQRIVTVCTNSGYGIGQPNVACDEDSALRPISLYGRLKVEAEKAYLEHEDTISLRLATVFGVSPRMRVDLLVNDFVYRAVRDRAVVLFEGHFRRNYIHVRDVARLFAFALDNFEAMQGRVFNAGLDDANLTKLELCALIQKLVPEFTFLEAPIGRDPDRRDYIVSNARLRATGFQTEWSLPRGIHELIKCYRSMITGSLLGNA